jgi:hypothetical protein
MPRRIAAPSRILLPSLVPVLVVAWLAGSAPPAGAGGAARPDGLRSLQNVNVSRMLRSQDEQTIAVNPTNPKNIVVTSNLDKGKGLMEAYSFDGGVSWSSGVIADGGVLGHACCDSQTAFDPYGDLFMAYLYGVRGVIPVAMSTDGGRTFRMIARLTSAPNGSAGPTPPLKLMPGAPVDFGDQPSIAVGPSGTPGQYSLWVSWTAVPGARISAAGARINSPGHVGAFIPTEQVPDASGRGDYGGTAIGPQGQVLVTYQRPPGGQGPAKIDTALDPDGLGPRGFEHPQQLAVTNVGGFDYIPAQPDRSVDAEANLAWDYGPGFAGEGRLYVVWTSEDVNESNDLNIMFQHSDDAGATWSPAVRLNTDTGTNSQFMPAIAVDHSTGWVGVSWYDARADLGRGGAGDTDHIPNDDARFWAATSTSHGQSFGPNLRVSAGTSNAGVSGNPLDYGDYTQATFVDGTFWTVWSDNSNSTGDNPDGTLHALDIYVAPVTVR